MTRTTLFTVVLGFALVACAGQPVGGGGPNNDDTDTTPNDPNNPNDPMDPNDPNDPGGGVTASAVLDRIATTECDQAFTCMASFPTELGAFADIFGASVEECYPLNAEYWNADDVEAAIAGGTITFDQAAADECMAGAITAAVCTTFWDEGPGVPDACWGAFAGTVATGGACTLDFECAEGSCGQAGTCAADTGQ